MDIGNEIAIVFSSLTLFVTVTGWYFTHKAQQDLAEQQRMYDRKKETRQDLAPTRMRQLDQIEAWLSQAVPLATWLLQAPNDQHILSQSLEWQLQVPNLLQIASQYDETHKSVLDEDRWTPDSSLLPADLPQLISAVGIMNMICIQDLRLGKHGPAKSAYIKLINLHGKAYDALVRVRQRTAQTD